MIIRFVTRRSSKNERASLVKFDSFAPVIIIRGKTYPSIVINEDIVSLIEEVSELISKQAASTLTYLCQKLAGRLRVIVPTNFRKKVFDAVHSITHPGVRASRILLAKDFIWTSMNKDVADFVRSCQSCQKNKHKFFMDVVLCLKSKIL